MGYEGLPDWVAVGEEPDASLRDEGNGKEVYVSKESVPAARELDKAVERQSVPKVASGKGKSLDDWLAEEEGSTEEETEGSEEETEEEEESESESGGSGEGDRLVRR